MREIKFRAWDRNTMYSVVSIDFNNNIAVGCSNSEWFEFDIENLMQYTGLKDKNGVEIYEGDIVYIAGQGFTEIEFPFTELYEANYENDIGHILGNIYEHPHLLEEK